MNGLTRTKCKEIPANTQLSYSAIYELVHQDLYAKTQSSLKEKVELLGVTIDKKLKFDAHVAKICRRVSQQVAVLRRMKKMLPFETRIHEAVPVVYCTALQLLRRNMELLQQERNH